MLASARKAASEAKVMRVEGSGGVDALRFARSARSDVASKMASDENIGFRRMLEKSRQLGRTSVTLILYRREILCVVIRVKTIENSVNTGVILKFT